MSKAAKNPDSRRTAAEQSKFRILEAAEQAFAEDGYSGTSMRAIAQHAEVTTGLLHYHFATKKNLYAAIVSWRAEAINKQRLYLLEVLPDTPSIPEILHALFQPALGIGNHARTNAALGFHTQDGGPSYWSNRIGSRFGAEYRDRRDG